MDDAELARRAAAGEGEAFGELVERHGLAGRRVAGAILGVGEDADDAVQNGLIAAWRAIDRYDRRRPFRPWLMRIVANAALDLHRRRRVRDAASLSEYVPDAHAGPDRVADRALFRERFRKAIATLPEKHRVAVVLFDVEGYAHAEIAQVLGVPEGTVRSYVFHARRALRESLAAYGEELKGGEFKEDTK